MKFNHNGKRICDGKKCRKSSKLQIHNNRMYCKFHILYPHVIHPYLLRKSTNKLHKLKSHITMINDVHHCHRILCDETNLINAHNGLFCVIHSNEIKDIRDQILHDNSVNDIILHIDEYSIRKIPCMSHVNYILRNLNKLYYT